MGCDCCKEIAPADYHKDSYEKISKLEALEWNTDSKAWQQASSANTISKIFGFTTFS